MANGPNASSSFAPLYIPVPRFSLRRLLTIAIALAGCLAPALSPAQQRNSAQPTAPPSIQQAAPTHPSGGQAVDYLRLPISFEANRGQAGSRVKFLARGAGYTLLLKSGEAEFSLEGGGPKAGGAVQKENWRPGGPAKRPVSPPNFRKQNDLKSPFGPKSLHPPSILHVKLDGANARAQVAGVDKLPGVSNYYIGNDPKKWHTGIPTYSRVEYQNVYPGVDLVYYGSQQRLEYDFVVSPGADPDRIQMGFSTAAARTQSEQGAQTGVAPRISANGDLLVETAGGEVRFHAPIAYQPAVTIDEVEAGSHTRPASRKYVQAKYVLEPGHKVGFRISVYDPTRPLVIDPAVSFATAFARGAQGNYVYGMGLDASDNAYILGGIVPASGYEQVVVLGMNAQGNSMLYTTTLGGSSSLSPGGIAVDPAGDAYIDGSAPSGFPTTPGAYSSSCSGNCGTPVVVKLSPSGSLLFSTYLGGSNTSAHAIAIDASGDAYITGQIDSTDLPLVNAFQPQFAGTACSGCSNAFVQKLDPTGSQLLYSTYFGSARSSGLLPVAQGAGIAVDASGSAYVVGNGFVPVKNPLEQDVGPMFLAKFTPDGSSLVYSTQLGGSGSADAGSTMVDTANALAVDSSGNAYVTGEAVSPDFPITMNAFRASCLEAAADACTPPQAFVLKVDPNGTSLVYSTLLGSGWAPGITLDSSGNVWVTGYVASNYFPTIQPIELTFQPNSYSASNDPSFLTRLDSSGTPTFSTFFGGNLSGPLSEAVAVDGNGNAYIAGVGGGGDFPLVNPSPDTASTEGGIFLARISPSATGPVLSLTPRGLAELRDLSTSPVTINSITASSNIVLYGETCGSSLPAGSSCIIFWESVDPRTFQSGTITVSSNAPGSPQTFTVYNGIPNTILISPDIEFPAQLAGTLSAPQTVTLSNFDFPTDITITSIQIPAPSPSEGSQGVFTQTSDCPATLPAGSSCHINVQFQPVAATDGRMFNALNIDTSTGSYVVNLRGYESSESLALSARSIQFGLQYVGATPLPRVLTLTNTDVQPVTVGGVSVSGPFSETNNCTGPLAPHASCRVSISFVPTNNDSYTGELTVNSSGTGSPETVSLAGAGMVLADIGVSPYALTFRAYPGSTDTQPVTLTNVSTLAVAISGFNVTPGNFTQTNDCNGSLAAAATCTVNVTFSPLADGTVNGSLAINFSGQGSPQIVPLAGSLYTPLQIVPTSLDFGQQALNITSTARGVGLSNQSTTPVYINSINVSGDFQLAANNCPNSIQPSFACNLQVTFTPNATGVATGTLTVSASDTSTPHTVPLSGTGAVVPGVSLNPTALFFDTQQGGTTSPPQNITLQNTGDAPLAIAGLAASGDFAETNNCGTSVAAGSGCAISVTFTPTGEGTLYGALSITDNAPGSPQTVKLSGAAHSAEVLLSPLAMTFPSRALNTTSSPQTESLMNSGTVGMAISGITITGDFAETNDCPATLAAGVSCAISVTFTPTAQGPRTGTLTVNDNAPGGPQTVALSGSGASDFVLGVDPGTPSAGTVKAGSAATYSIAISPVGGFNQTVVFECSGAPAGVSCTVSPTSATLDGANNLTVTVNVKTTAASAMPPGAPGGPLAPGSFAVYEWWMALAMLLMMVMMVRTIAHWRRHIPLLAGAVLLAAVAMSCGGGGGGGSGGGGTPTPVTPAGTYTLTVTGTSGGLQHQTSLTLTVQ